MKKRTREHVCLGIRERLCTACIDSAQAGKSKGVCVDIESEESRCRRCDAGGNTCEPVPLLLVPLANALFKARFYDALEHYGNAMPEHGDPESTYDTMDFFNVVACST